MIHKHKPKSRVNIHEWSIIKNPQAWSTINQNPDSHNPNSNSPFTLPAPFLVGHWSHHWAFDAHRATSRGDPCPPALTTPLIKSYQVDFEMTQNIVEGSLEVKLPTIWTDEKQSRAEAERRERLDERRSEKRKNQKKEDADARKGGKVAKHCVFPMICGSGGLKSRLAKAAGAEPSGQTRDEKLHAVVAQSICPSQNVQDTPWSDHFWKLRCRKSACRCSAKHISKSKCTKHLSLGPLLEVEMSKKCTPLWQEAHFEVKMHKTSQHRTTFGSWDVEKAHAVVARSTFQSQNVKNTRGSDHFWTLRCRKCARRCGAKHISKSKC